MSRVEVKTNYKCPICNDLLILDIKGESSIVDHEYGFEDFSEDANGYICNNKHRVIIFKQEE